jgi:hypothetical protein
MEKVIDYKALYQKECNHSLTLKELNKRYLMWLDELLSSDFNPDINLRMQIYQSVEFAKNLKFI